MTMTGKILMCLWTLFFIPAEFRKLCPKSVTSPIRIKDPDDCTKYHLCVDMREFIITCPDHYVVSERSMKCVPEGSVFDTCEYKLYIQYFDWLFLLLAIWVVFLPSSHSKGFRFEYTKYAIPRACHKYSL